MKFNRNSYIFIKMHLKLFVVCEMAASLSRSQCVNNHGGNRMLPECTKTLPYPILINPWRHVAWLGLSQTLLMRPHACTYGVGLCDYFTKSYKYKPKQSWPFEIVTGYQRLQTFGWLTDHLIWYEDRYFCEKKPMLAEIGIAMFTYYVRCILKAMNN